MPTVLRRLGRKKRTPIQLQCSHFVSRGIHKLLQLLNCCNSRPRMQKELSADKTKKLRRASLNSLVFPYENGASRR